MNTYRTCFHAICPSNEVRVFYSLTIEHHEMIKVETITEVVSSMTIGYHEDFADRLALCLPGRQTLRADHHGVEIESRRGF